MAPLPKGIQRVSAIPMLLSDVVRVSDPEIIRKININPDVGRIGNSEPPWILKMFFRASKFFHPSSGMYHITQLDNGSFEQEQRRKAALHQVSVGFSKNQLDTLSGLVHSDKDLHTVTKESGQVMSSLVLSLPEGQKLPDDVAEANINTLNSITAVFNPIRYIRALRARGTVENYVQNQKPSEKYVGDFVHNLGASFQGFGRAMTQLRNAGQQDALSFFCQNPIVPAVMRVPKVITTLDGIFPEDQPLIPGKTVIILEIGEAAKESKDPTFLFGPGSGNRECPIMNLFFKTAASVQGNSLDQS